jgi:hypothetical protein
LPGHIQQKWFPFWWFELKNNGKKNAFITILRS